MEASWSGRDKRMIGQLGNFSVWIETVFGRSGFGDSFDAASTPFSDGDSTFGSACSEVSGADASTFDFSSGMFSFSLLGTSNGTTGSISFVPGNTFASMTDVAA